jgi:hypothetical protein
MSRLPLLLVAAALAFPATAEARICPSKSVYEITKATNVSCTKAKAVLKDYWKDGVAPGSWSCHQKQYPGGVTTKCRKGDRRIVHQSAD